MRLSRRDALVFSIATLTPEIAATAAPFRAWQIEDHPVLRDYQIALLLEALRLMAMGYRRILIQLCCGGGKTKMAAAMFMAAQELGRYVNFVVHRKELTDQTSREFTAQGIPHGFITSDPERPNDFNSGVTISGIQTLVRRLAKLLPYDLVVIDEAQHATASTYGQLLDHLDDETFVIGLSGSPERLDGKGLIEQFDVMICGPQPQELIDMGYLTDFDYYAPDVPDMTGVATVAGDFNKRANAEKMGEPKLIGNAVEHYLRLAKGEQGIVYEVSRENSRRMADAFQAEGVNAKHIDGAMDKDDRRRTIAAFAAGDLQMLTNVDLIGEGLDVPRVSYIGLRRPTKSLSMFIQQSMRNMRPFPGKHRSVTCDHAGNALLTGQGHGLPSNDREWSLLGREGRPKSSGPSDATSIRQCKKCFKVSPSTVKICPCGEEFPASVRKLLEAAGQLTKLEREQAKRAAEAKRKAELKMCITPAQLIAFAEARGYENPRNFAKVQLKLRAGGFHRR